MFYQKHINQKDTSHAAYNEKIINELNWHWKITLIKKCDA